MRLARTRASDSTFDLNLAPVLDIIVSVVPMLLLSVAFIQVKMIETPIPQVVAQAIEDNRKKNELTITLEMSKKDGFTFVLKEGDKKEQKVRVALTNGQFDLDQLYQQALQIKRQHPAVFDLSLSPSGDVPLNEMVAVMDRLRRVAAVEDSVVFNDASGKPVKTDLLYPYVTFANVVGD